LMFKLLLRLHPELRRRVAAARETFATRRWRQELRVWDEERKPAAIRVHLELQGIDPATLGTDALFSYLDRCRENWLKMIEQHHRFDVAAILPVGDFIAHATAWTGLDPARLCELLGGASDVSSGASPELDRLRAALGSDANARALLDDAKSPAEAIATLRGADGELGAAARTWLDLVSCRLQNGLDICELTNGEMPELLLTTIRRALDGAASSNRSNASPDSTAVRERVPAAHRAAFDELLAEVIEGKCRNSCSEQFNHCATPTRDPTP